MFVEMVAPGYTQRPKEELDDDSYYGLITRHFNNIAQGDVILIFDYEGYVGNSTSMEIGYARALHKRVVGLMKAKDETVNTMFDSIICPDQDITDMKHAVVAGYIYRYLTKNIFLRVKQSLQRPVVGLQGIDKP